MQQAAAQAALPLWRLAGPRVRPAAAAAVLGARAAAFRPHILRLPSRPATSPYAAAVPCKTTVRRRLCDRPAQLPALQHQRWQLQGRQHRRRQHRRRQHRRWQHQRQQHDQEDPGLGRCHLSGLQSEPRQQHPDPPLLHPPAHLQITRLCPFSSMAHRTAPQQRIPVLGQQPTCLPLPHGWWIRLLQLLLHRLPLHQWRPRRAQWGQPFRPGRGLPSHSPVHALLPPKSSRRSIRGQRSSNTPHRVGWPLHPLPLTSSTSTDSNVKRGCPNQQSPLLPTSTSLPSSPCLYQGRTHTAGWRLSSALQLLLRFLRSWGLRQLNLGPTQPCGSSNNSTRSSRSSSRRSSSRWQQWRPRPGRPSWQLIRVIWSRRQQRGRPPQALPSLQPLPHLQPAYLPQMPALQPAVGCCRGIRRQPLWCHPPTTSLRLPTSHVLRLCWQGWQGQRRAQLQSQRGLRVTRTGRQLGKGVMVTRTGWQGQLGWMWGVRTGLVSCPPQGLLVPAGRPPGALPPLQAAPPSARPAKQHRLLLLLRLRASW